MGGPVRTMDDCGGNRSGFGLRILGGGKGFITGVSFICCSEDLVIFDVSELLLL